MLRLRRLALIPTLRCTLNCRLCCNSVPLYRNPPFLPLEELARDLQALFDLVDSIEWIQLVGGEIFLYPQLAPLLREIRRCDSQFDKLILMTNGTLTPGEEALAALQEYGPRCQVQISDYGKYSFRIRELEDLFRSCWQIGMKNYHMYQGKIHNCIRSLFGLDLGLIPVPEEEYVDVRDTGKSREEKRAALARFDTRPLTACRYCGGFDTARAKRYPAAEQAPRL